MGDKLYDMIFSLFEKLPLCDEIHELLSVLKNSLYMCLKLPVILQVQFRFVCVTIIR